MSVLGTAAAVLVLLGVLILVHELGHFVFAKLFDVKVLRFSLGFGPRIVGFTWGETEYRLSADSARRLRAPAGRRSRRADSAHRPAARAGGKAAVAALHGRGRGAGLQPAAAALHLLRSLRGPAHDAAADDRDGAARPARRERGPAAGRSGRDVDGQPVRYWEELEHKISVSAGKTLRFGIRRGPDAEERDVTPIEIERTGPLRRKERLGWIGVSPRFHLPEIGVLDPSSPAAQAGLQDVRFHHGGQRRSGRDLDRVRAGGRTRRGVAVAPELRAGWLLGGAVRAHRDRRAGIGGRHPRRRLRHRRAAALRDRHPVGGAVRLLGRAREPRR